MTPRHAPKPLSGIQKAVLQAGSQGALALRLGVSQQAIQKWVRNGYAPVGRVVEIECEYGIPRRELLQPRLADLADTGLMGDK